MNISVILLATSLVFANSASAAISLQEKLANKSQETMQLRKNVLSGKGGVAVHKTCGGGTRCAAD